MGTIRKYWTGWLSGEKARDTEQYWPHWEKAADDAAAEGCDLVIFKIPQRKNGNMDGDTVVEIEKLLQDKYGRQ